MTVRAEFESEWHARFVVLGMGARVRVIEPAELARSVAAEIEAVAKELLNQATAGARM
jgi:predicted DNA-binding transcriptional regulator YafY